MPSELRACLNAIEHAYSVAKEQQSSAYVTLDEGCNQYGAHETIEGVAGERLLCVVYPNGDLTWPVTHVPDGD